MTVLSDKSDAWGGMRQDGEEHGTCKEVESEALSCQHAQCFGKHNLFPLSKPSLQSWLRAGMQIQVRCPGRWGGQAIAPWRGKGHLSREKGKAEGKGEEHEGGSSRAGQVAVTRRSARLPSGKASAMPESVLIPPHFSHKRMGTGRRQIFLTQKIPCDEEERNYFAEYPLFFFFHISSLFFLAKSLFLYVFPPPNCFILFEVYWRGSLFREVRSEQGPVLHTSREEEAFPLKSLPSSFLSSFSNHTFLSASFSLSKRELLPLVTVKQQRWVMLQTATGAAWEPR